MGTRFFGRSGSDAAISTATSSSKWTGNIGVIGAGALGTAFTATTIANLIQNATHRNGSNNGGSNGNPSFLDTFFGAIPGGDTIKQTILLVGVLIFVVILWKMFMN